VDLTCMPIRRAYFKVINRSFSKRVKFRSDIAAA
jgi:hypothetical protein